MSATGAFAQSVEETKEEKDKKEAVELETVTVTGIRRGIENAIETKRESTSIVETISAEDIGKLPDISIAESLARLPGLTAQRVAGRATTVPYTHLDVYKRQPTVQLRPRVPCDTPTRPGQPHCWPTG